MFVNKKLPSYERNGYTRKIFIDLHLMVSSMAINPENYPDLPKGFIVHENQVAGHTFSKEKKELGNICLCGLWKAIILSISKITFKIKICVVNFEKICSKDLGVTSRGLPSYRQSFKY